MTRYDVIEATPLVYGGVAIREKGEMLSLTDMWKAAGSPENMRPTDWAALPQSKGFIEAVSESSNTGISGIWVSRRGNNGGTHAHWQIGLAYAKYLNHEFHMWCNQVVRERMEGQPKSVIPADTLEQIERSFGMMRMVAHKVTEIEKAIPGIVANLIEPLIAARLAEKNLLLRRGVTAKQIWDRYNLPPKMRGATLWLGNRLTEMGAGASKADRGDGSIRLYDPDLAEACMKNGLNHKAKVYASERMGQTRLNLINGGK